MVRASQYGRSGGGHKHRHTQPPTHPRPLHSARPLDVDGGAVGFPPSFVERGGFEVQRVQNLGSHYSITLQQWCDEWRAAKTEIVAKWGEKAFRRWEVMSCHVMYCHAIRARPTNAAPRRAVVFLFSGFRSMRAISHDRASRRRTHAHAALPTIQTTQ